MTVFLPEDTPQDQHVTNMVIMVVTPEKDQMGDLINLITSLVNTSMVEEDEQISDSE